DWDEVVDQATARLQEMASRRGANRAVYSPRLITPAKASAPQSMPRSIKPMQVRRGMSAVAEMRHGIFQYLPDDYDVGPSLGWYGEWLESELRLLTGLIRGGQTALEGDADVGAHSVALGRAVGSDGHLILYESRAKQKNILTQNIRANGLANVTIMCRSLVGI